MQGRGIRVNVVSPGPVKTPGLGGLVAEEERKGLFDALAAQVPLGRIEEGKEHTMGEAGAHLRCEPPIKAHVKQYPVVQLMGSDSP